MKYNAFFKFLAIVLAVICAVTGVISGLLVVLGVDQGWYHQAPAESRLDRLYSHAAEYASQIAERTAFLHSGMSRNLWDETFAQGLLGWGIYPQVEYTLTVLWPDGTEETADTRRRPQEAYVYSEEVVVTNLMGYAVPLTDEPQWTWPPEEPSAEPTEATETVNPGETASMPTTSSGEPTMPPEDTEAKPGTYLWKTVGNGGPYLYNIYRYEVPAEFTIVLNYTQAELDSLSYNEVPWELEQVLYRARFHSLAVAMGSVVILLAMLIYLGFAAGRKPGSDEVKPGGMNRIPLDLYAGADCFVGFWLAYLVYLLIRNLEQMDSYAGEAVTLLLAAALGAVTMMALICVLYWCAFWAQVKAPKGYWWRNSLVGRCLGGLWNLAAGILRWMVAPVGKKWEAWQNREKKPGLGAALKELVDRLPLMWQWLAVSMGIFLLMALLGALIRNPMGLILYLFFLVFACLAVVYAANAFGALREGAKRMSRGELDAKVNADALEGCFRDFARDLNALSETCVTAAREQLKSDRMKTELITNVSHDIKTPLTSIINYVDLLQKAETEEQRKEYLAVLDRQSVRLKKLIEDLMEMSKASSGNVSVEIAPIDVVESVNQALGEYADRLAERKLQVLLRKPGEPVMAMCDGRLLWRVLSNVITNVVKYAMPGTRVYLDLSAEEQKVVLAVKNISAQELNVSADELLERFVRGDESRNTEGNGLGLNIARSLMEVQKGNLELYVDGDLFKVVLTLPKA